VPDAQHVELALEVAEDEEVPAMPLSIRRWNLIGTGAKEA
jgi:hypothetical protein